MSQSTNDIKPNATYSEVRSVDCDWPKYRSKEYFEYRRKWSEYPRKLEVPDFPLCIDIETTNLCNLRCPMCSRTIQIDDGSYVDIGTMEMKLYRKIIDEGEQHGLYSVKLNFLGEPLSDRYIVERVKYAKDHGVLDVMFNTNASMLTEEMSHKLLDAGLDSIFFSVDGINPESFNKIRIGTNYETVVKNIRNFMKIKNEGNYNHVQTRISMTMLPDIENESSAFAKFWLPITKQVGYGEWVDHSIKNEDDKKNPQYNYNPNFVCPQPFQRIFVMYDGICTSCCLDVDRSYVLGDANKKSIKEIWNDEPIKKMREAQKNHSYMDIEMCSSCYLPWAQKNQDM
jgi:MoaA/NifB/PqqE/SkfB family radical SAM enzyme